VAARPAGAAHPFLMAAIFSGNFENAHSESFFEDSESAQKIAHCPKIAHFSNNPFLDMDLNYGWVVV